MHLGSQEFGREMFGCGWLYHRRPVKRNFREWYFFPDDHCSSLTILERREQMDNQPKTNQQIFKLILSLALLLSLLLPAAGAGLAGLPSSYQHTLPYRGQSQDIPPELPVFRLVAPLVNTESAGDLASRLDNLSFTEVMTGVSHTGTPRFFVEDNETGGMLEQYVSGGFFAFNSSLAFQETPALLRYTARQICNFLLIHELFPNDTLPAATNCDILPLPYESSPIYLATLDQSAPGLLEAGDYEGATATQHEIGQLWKVPLAINVGGVARANYIPLGGPGGHLSLLLTGHDNRIPLDSDLTGLQALAVPSWGHQRELIDLYKVIPMEMATADLSNRLQAAMPGAQLDLGEPELIYYVEDPAEEQENLMPVWQFPDATAMVDGQEVNLRIYNIPAVEGFLPEVEITDPLDGQIYWPGDQVEITALISSGKPPYTYTLQLEDGTPLAAGASASGAVTITTTPLPISDRPDQGLFLELVAVDDHGATASDSLILMAPQRLFAPLLMRMAEQAPQVISTAAFPVEVAPASTLATRTMGAEWIRYYNGHGSNLPGTQPDGTGFYNKLLSRGWIGRFHWYNNNAWEKDWRDCSLGGIDCTAGVDRVDFAYFAGHGSPARIYFGVNKDGYNFFASNARFQNLRWAGFATCQTLRGGPYVGPGNPPLTYWFNSFQGSYMLLGFHSNMADVAFGPRFVDNMIPGRPIREAWVLTAFQMNAGKPAYLYARSSSFNPVNLSLPGHGGLVQPLPPGSIISYNWVWWN
jgi:hypothetical protein